LRTPTLAALLHGTPAAGVSQTLRRGIEGMELHNFRRGRHLYSAGRPSRWALAHILVVSVFNRALVSALLLDLSRPLFYITASFVLHSCQNDDVDDDDLQKCVTGVKISAATLKRFRQP